MNKNNAYRPSCFFDSPRFAQTDSQWVLEQSTLTYHVSHPLHQVDGVSRAARGKGVCHAGQCDFLIAVPVSIVRFQRQQPRSAHAASRARRTISDGYRAHAFARRGRHIGNHSCRPGGPVCWPDHRIQTSAIPTDHARKRDKNIRNYSGHVDRFQDRSAVSSDAPREERNTGAG